MRSQTGRGIWKSLPLAVLAAVPEDQSGTSNTKAAIPSRDCCIGPRKSPPIRYLRRNQRGPRIHQFSGSSPGLAHRATLRWRSGNAQVCKTCIAGSNPARSSSGAEPKPEPPGNAAPALRVQGGFTSCVHVGRASIQIYSMSGLARACANCGGAREKGPR